ncbi:YcaO-like family protein [Nostoc sp. CHAB 5834]|nr:YcaO-like family protein [Nostoc sp. CHAB 5834]
MQANFVSENYSQLFSIEKVDVQPAFKEAPDLLIARTAAFSKSFPKNPYSQGMRVITGAACGLSEYQVRVRAFGELLERLSAFNSGNESICLKASYLDLQAKAVPTISPNTLQLFNSTQVISDEVSTELDAAILSWCTGFDLVAERYVYVPALVAYFSWKPPQGEKVFVKPNANGLAAGTNPYKAQCRALLEVIERNTCMQSWHTLKVTVFSLNLDAIPTTYTDCCRTLGLVIELYSLETVHLPPTILTLISRPNGNELTVGSACDLSITSAIEKATQEALMLQWTMRNTPLTSVSIKCPKTSLERVAYTYEHGSLVRNWYRSHAIPHGKYYHDAFDCNLHQLASVIRETYGCEVLSVDVTDTMSRMMGWSVFRVLLSNNRLKESNSMVHYFEECTKTTKLLPECEVIGESQTSPSPFG